MISRVIARNPFLVLSGVILLAAAGVSGQQAPPSPSQSTDNIPAAQMQIDLKTQPEPPRKGANTLHVMLTGADGKPVTGTQVTVTFFMPAMPEMDMAEMNAVSDLVEKGDGMYEGSLQLPSGGRWQVTVTVKHGTQTLATKHLILRATGGM